MTNLIQQYVQAGIIQFGRFQRPDGAFDPLAINSLLLPSYPALLQQTARALALHIQTSAVDRLLATRTAIPLGAVTSVESGIPLTYPYGQAREYTVAFTIEGAYDVGHPTLLLTDVVKDSAEIFSLVNTAARVGLRVDEVVCLFQWPGITLEGISVTPLFDLFASIPDLARSGYLTGAMQKRISSWLEDGR